MTLDDALRLARTELRKYPKARALPGVREAQAEAGRAGRAAGQLIVRLLPGLPSGERGRFITEVLRESNRAALDAAERMQRTRAAAIGEESLGIVRGRFHQQRAANLATYAETMLDEREAAGETLTDEQRAAIVDTVENNARIAVDDAERGLAEARYNMGRRAMIVRTASGRNTCEWCAAAAGEYEYGPTMDKEMAFGRHANCACLIEYYPGDGKIETVRNYRK